MFSLSWSSVDSFLVSNLFHRMLNFTSQLSLSCQIPERLTVCGWELVYLAMKGCSCVCMCVNIQVLREKKNMKKESRKSGLINAKLLGRSVFLIA